MHYEIESIKKNHLISSQWSGGTTTQLLICPKNAIYSERNFIWRLSSAKVEVDESLFTHLPGISRIIMILKGELRLEHKGHHSTVLKKFDQDSFKGEWNTKSYGKVTDFNLMMSQNCRGKLETILLKNEVPHEELLHTLDNGTHTKVTSVFYCVNGTADISIDSEKEFKLEEGDLLAVTSTTSELPISLKLLSIGKDDLEIVKSTIYY
jgi:environmental stress-induced protein Ves